MIEFVVCIVFPVESEVVFCALLFLVSVPLNRFQVVVFEVVEWYASEPI